MRTLGNTLTVMAFGLLLSTGHAETREWTSKAGTKVKAELVKLEADKVVLKLDSGKEVTVNLVDLSEDDQKFLKQAETAKVETPAAAGSQRFLPELQDGAGKGFHAVYKGDDFQAKVDKGGGMVINPIIDGKVNEKWAINIVADIYEQKANDREKFWFVSFEEYAAAKENPEKVRLVGTRRGGTKCEVVYEFGKNYVTTWFRAEPSDELKTKENIVYRMRHLVGKTTDMDSSEKFAKRCKLKQTMANGDRKSYDFWEAVKLGGDTEEIEIGGPLVGKSKMTFTRGKSEQIKFAPYQYGEAPLTSGFAIYMYKPDPATSEQDKEKTTITFK